MIIKDIIKIILKEFELGEIRAYIYVNGLITNARVEYKKNVMLINNFPELPPLTFKFNGSHSKIILRAIEVKKDNEVSSLDLTDLNNEQLRIYQLLYAPLLLSTVEFEHEEIQDIPIKSDVLGDVTLENSIVTLHGKYSLGYSFFRNLINFLMEGKDSQEGITQRDITIRIDLGNYIRRTQDFYRINFMPRLLEIEQEEILSRDDMISIKFDPPTFFKD